MNLGKQIQYYRRQAGITQEVLASELGVSVAAVSKWENDCSVPDILMLCSIADYFKVTTDELLGRTNHLAFAVCDDAAIIREALKTIVQKEGYQCPVLTENAAQLKEALENTVPYAVFLDLSLPDENGMELLKWLKQNYPEMKVIIVTADSSKESQEKAISLGADSYITKPFLPEFVAATITSLTRENLI